MTQIEVLRTLLRYLSLNSTSNWKQSMNEAIASFSIPEFPDFNSVITALATQWNDAASNTEFLKNSCGIDFTNVDNGSIFGKDAGGDTAYSSIDLIPEDGSVGDIVYPSSNTTVNYNNAISLIYGDLSGMTAVRRHLLGCLNTWWMNGATARFNQLFTIDGSNPLLRLPVRVEPMPGTGFVAAVSSSFLVQDSKFPQSMELIYNTQYTDSISLNNLDGQLNIPGQTDMLLDVTTLHELTHAVHNAVIPYCGYYYPAWFKEGLAVVCEGGDYRQTDISYYLSTATYSSLINDFDKMKLPDYPFQQAPYAQGFIFFRFLCKQIAESGSTPVPPPEGESHFYDLGDKLLEKGTAFTLHEVGRNFIKFAQKSGEEIQAWELVQDRFESFIGATFKVPMKNWEIPVESELSGDTVLSNSSTLVDGITVGNDSNMPCFYISLQYQKVNANTYENYLTTVGNIGFSDLVYGDGQGTQFNVNVPHNRHYSGITQEYSVEGRTISNIQFRNMFNETGEFIAISPHILFDNSLWMCEQGGNACLPLETNPAILNFRKYIQNVWGCSGTGHTEEVYSPIFPGTGVPWLTVSDDNLSEYITGANAIHYWFTKTDYNATITFKLANGSSDAVYQSIAFGLLDSVKESAHMFPLFVAGGRTPLKTGIYKYIPLNARCPKPVYGNVYGLNMKDIEMFNSNLLHPTDCCGGTITNFRVMDSNGLWRYIKVHEQSAHIQSFYRCICGGVVCDPVDWGVVLEEPIDDLALGSTDFIFPRAGRNARFTIDTYTVNKEFSRFEYSSPLQKILVFLNDKLHPYDGGCIGFIPNVFVGWFADLPCGEIELGGKKYLSIPCAWDKRMWKYPSRMGSIVNEQDDFEEVEKRWSYYINPLNHQSINDRILIPIDRGV